MAYFTAGILRTLIVVIATLNIAGCSGDLVFLATACPPKNEVTVEDTGDKVLIEGEGSRGLYSNKSA
ncbi:MAG: hypothetical protein ACUVQ0_07060 [Thermoproteota archaeon]